MTLGPSASASSPLPNGLHLLSWPRPRGAAGGECGRWRGGVERVRYRVRPHGRGSRVRGSDHAHAVLVWRRGGRGGYLRPCCMRTEVRAHGDQAGAPADAPADRRAFFFRAPRDPHQASRRGGRLRRALLLRLCVRIEEEGRVRCYLGCRLDASYLINVGPGTRRPGWAGAGPGEIWPRGGSADGAQMARVTPSRANRETRERCLAAHALVATSRWSAA